MRFRLKLLIIAGSSLKARFVPAKMMGTEGAWRSISRNTIALKLALSLGEGLGGKGEQQISGEIKHRLFTYTPEYSRWCKPKRNQACFFRLSFKISLNTLSSHNTDRYPWPGV